MYDTAMSECGVRYYLDEMWDTLLLLRNCSVRYQHVGIRRFAFSFPRPFHTRFGPFLTALLSDLAPLPFRLGGLLLFVLSFSLTVCFLSPTPSCFCFSGCTFRFCFYFFIIVLCYVFLLFYVILY